MGFFAIGSQDLHGGEASPRLEEINRILLPRIETRELENSTERGPSGSVPEKARRRDVQAADDQGLVDLGSRFVHEVAGDACARFKGKR